MKKTLRESTLSLVIASAALCGCAGGADKGEQTVVPPNAFLEGITPGVREGEKAAIVDSKVDYGLALRSAALRLTGNYPTLAEIKLLRDAADQPTTYAGIINGYLSDPRFAAEQKAFWSDTFRMGGTKKVGTVTLNLDAAPTYAAMLVVQGLPFTNVVTASSGTCQALQADGSFAAGSCPNTSGDVVGVLSDPGMHAQFFSSMAFRRTRWIQETFMCAKFPAEIGTRKENHPGGAYLSPWDFKSITGGKDPSVRVDFQADDSLICANCHTTINHIAPLLGKYDMAGLLQAGFAVVTPVPGNPMTVLADWLPAGQSTAWRYQQPVADLRGLGQAIANDPGFGRCVATRVWNWAFSRGDVVVDQAVLPSDMEDQLAAGLKASNYNVKELIRQVFTGASFVRY